MQSEDNIQAAARLDKGFSEEEKANELFEQVISIRDMDFRSKMVDLTPEELGQLVLDYIHGCDDTGWEGWKRSEKLTIVEWLADMALYHTQKDELEQQEENEHEKLCARCNGSGSDGYGGACSTCGGKGAF